MTTCSLPAAEPHNEPLLAKLIGLTTSLLRDLIESEGCECHSMFNCEKVPQISLEAYLRRLHKYTRFSPQCLLLSVVYLDRYNMAEPEFSLTWLNAHRVLLTCLILAVKFNDDVYFDNLTFEKAGLVPISQLLQYELELFSKIGYSAYVGADEYQCLLDKLEGVYGEEDS